ASSVMKPPILTQPPVAEAVSAPSVEAISQQAEQMSVSAQAEIPAAAAAPQAPTPPAAPPAPEAADTASKVFGLAVWLSRQLPNLPQMVMQAAEYVDRQVVDEASLQLYRTALEECRRLLALPGMTPLHALAAALEVHLHNPESANAHITAYRKAGGDDVVLLVWLYSRLLERYPQYVPALVARGQLLTEMQQADRAIADFETAMIRETLNAEVLGCLERLYRGKLEQAPNPTIEFKLVKIFLKQNRLDDAISVLQRLVNDPVYEQRALRILGLCFWQKNMYYLAWQKFKQLPVTDDLKDILYRLASDMEAADQLINARYALERILESDFGYRDVEARLKSINQRLKAQQDELDRTKTPASAEILQDSRFVILNEINRGSMGVVYRAHDKVLDEIVAIKVLNDYLCADPQAVQRFKREARAAKRLSHPNIVRIHEFYESSEKKFISMEYIEGRDLKKILLEKSRLSLAEIKKYFMAMCSALQYAHELDVVHRDIKPANVMITSQDTVKVTDFGIAKILRSEDVTRSSSMIMGTPLYMAPEQIEGQPVDGRCDIYSLGIMLYEAIAGRPPFTEGNIEYHHVYTTPPPLPDDVPDALKAIVLKCVEKKPEARFQNPGEVLAALEALQV
ncbi:MAG: serine/threonine protein kinase, partial [Candidatus Sumerlaeia bacterium]|nr:serine/threonine protein kinase [Candidatus Sumerlaeia bacterium]